MRRSTRAIIGVLVGAALLATACRSEPSVTLSASTVTWETYAYELTDFQTIRAGSFDGETRIEQTFDTWVLENEYLEVTLVPEFGGRILSIVYKPTGHEQLYQNPVGVPYQIDTGVFFHNWLMVWGGIFPTFPEPEHGKAWFLPWSFEVVEESGDAVTVAMSFTDDTDYPFAPPQYGREATGLTVTFAVTLRAGRSAVDTTVTIENPGDEPVDYEYWTNVTLAPGSDPSDPRTMGAAEIITPVDMIRIPSFWGTIAAQEEPTGLADVYQFDELRRFGNWEDLGIAYAFPDTAQHDFWGVIDQEVGEGLFRIADNSVTPGLKLWTWGYPQTVDLDPDAGPNEARPYVELWAGTSREFFQSVEIGAGEVIEFSETYAPTVGMSNVTGADDDVLIDLRIVDGEVECVIFGLHPGAEWTAVLTLDDGTVIGEESFEVDAADAFVFGAPLPAGVSADGVGTRVTGPDGEVLIEVRYRPGPGSTD